MSEVAMFGLQLNAAHTVSPTVARVRLEDLDDRRRAAVQPFLGPHRPGSAFNFYLMSALDADVTIPDDAIDALKVTLGRAFRSNTSVVRALKQLFQAAVATRQSATWALVEAQGQGLKVRPTEFAFSQELLATDFAHWPTVERTHFTVPRDMRILVELVASVAASANVAQATANATWEQIAARLASYADAPAANEAHAIAAGVLGAASSTSRDAILATSVDAAEAARRVAPRAQDAVTWASRERRADRLFGVWSTGARAFVHPAFQFRPEGGVHDRLGELLCILRAKEGFNPGTTDKGGWARAYWLFQPREELSARALAAQRMDHSDPVASALALSLIPDDRPRTPADAFAEAPQAVIDLAQALMDENRVAHD